MVLGGYPILWGAAQTLDNKLIEQVFQEHMSKLTGASNIAFLIESPVSSYAYNADICMVPGSIIKLVITALFLEVYGKDPKFYTKIYQKNPSIYTLFFEGDPSLNEEDVVKLLNKISADEKKLKIEVATSMAFFPELSPDWMIEDIPSSYIGPISPFQISDGRLNFKVRSALGGNGNRQPIVEMPVVYPYRYEGVGNNQYLEARWEGNASPILVLKGALPDGDNVFEDSISVPSSKTYLERLIKQWAAEKQYDVEIEFMASGKLQSAGTLITEHASGDFVNLLKETLSSSNNAFYDLLFFKLAEHGRDVTTTTWEEAGIAFMAKLKEGITALDWSPWYIRDGAGLSFKNTVRGKDLMAFLKWMRKSEDWPLWAEILPKPGSGTLKRKFNAIEDYLMGKPGTLSGVRNFMGFLHFKVKGDDSVEEEFWPVVLLVNHGFEATFQKFGWQQELMKEIVEKNLSLMKTKNPIAKAEI